MNLVKKISDFFKVDLVQRTIYGIGLLIWVYTFEDDVKYWNSESSIGVKYLWLIATPMILLIGQIIFNNKIIWGIIAGFVATYSLWNLWTFFYLNVLMDYIPKNNWPLADVFWFSVLLFLLFSVNWVVWKIKPNKKHIPQHE